jgi:hypothetical protein
MANRRFTQFYQTLHNKPVQLDCRFKVDSSDSGGLGITGLKGPGIAAVYMNTSATPASGNPNPAAGYIYVRLQDNYNQFYHMSGQMRSPLTGSDLAVSSGLSAGGVYVISVLGTSTAADWLALGVPRGISPAVGVPFVALVTGAGSGSGKVQLIKATATAANNIVVLGDPQLSIKSSAGAVLGSANGAYLILACLGATSSSVTTQIPIAPADGSHIYLKLLLGNSSVLVNGD